MCRFLAKTAVDGNPDDEEAIYVGRRSHQESGRAACPDSHYTVRRIAGRKCRTDRSFNCPEIYSARSVVGSKRWT